MKITKERLKTIIKEELENITQAAVEEAHCGKRDDDEEMMEGHVDKEMINQKMDQWMKANPDATPQETMNAYYELMDSMKGRM